MREPLIVRVPTLLVRVTAAGLMPGSTPDGIARCKAQLAELDALLSTDALVPPKSDEAAPSKEGGI